MRVSGAPHLRDRRTTRSLMLDVIIALLPAAGAGVYLFGPSALAVILVSVAGAVISELLWEYIAKKPITVGDLSAVVTGLILALTLPPGAPWWLALVGSAFAIVIVKQLFGGLGDNFLNPALAARAVLLASWPVGMTLYHAPSFFSGADAVTSATPLAGGSAGMLDLFLGNVPGSIGEVCKAAILLGLAYLLIRRVITWHIPVIYVGSFAVMMFALGGFEFSLEPVKAVLSGSVLFGASFMATDYVTSPMTKKGQAVYAAGCGVINAIIRSFGNYPEGTTYAILIMNIVTPLIDRLGRRVYGTAKGGTK